MAVDVLGRRAVFLAGLAVFTAARLAAGLTAGPAPAAVAGFTSACTVAAVAALLLAVALPGGHRRPVFVHWPRRSPARPVRCPRTVAVVGVLVFVH